MKTGRGKEFPLYECNKCSALAPREAVSAKIERQLSLKGIDPRNDRRGAVLATRNSQTNHEGIKNVRGA